MKHSGVLASLQKNLRGIARAQSQIDSGTRFQKASEDPNAAAIVLQTRAALRGLEQYQRNVGFAKGRVDAEEGILVQLGDALDRAIELAVTQGSDTGNETTRRMALYEAENLLGFAIQSANTRHGEGYLFGGFASDTPPIDPADPLRAHTPAELALLDQQHEVEIGAGQYVPSNHNAKEIFLDTGVIQALHDFKTALENNDGAAVRGALGALRQAASAVQDVLGAVGGRSNHLKLTASSLEAAELGLTTLKADIEEVDMARAMIELTSKQATYQAALLSTSRIMQLSLVDYLR
jgi:flagellar hook-associated protein 3 FlgL